MGKEAFKPKAAPKPLNFLSPVMAAKLTALLDGMDIVLDPTQFEKVVRGGKEFYRLKGREEFEGSTGAGGGGANQLTLKQGTADDKFQVIPGTVNGEMPTLATVALDAATPPEITVTADVWVWIKCVGTFGSPNTHIVTIEITTSSSPPSGSEITGTGFTSFQPIGSIDYLGGVPYVIANSHSGGNLVVTSFGLYNMWGRV